MRIGAFEGDGYHGFGNPDLWEQVCRDGFGLPAEPETDADFGLALYFTTSKKIASTYAQKFGRKPMIVKAELVLPRAIYLTFNGQRERWEGKTRTPSLAWIDMMVSKYGDPTGGQWGERVSAALRWREALLNDGVDGIIADNYDSPRTIAVFDPGQAIVDWACP